MVIIPRAGLVSQQWPSIDWEQLCRFYEFDFFSVFAKFGHKNGLLDGFTDQNLHWLDQRINLKGRLFLYDDI